jgi:60 kDa SS-A/Ro ribonucleoprotein
VAAKNRKIQSSATEVLETGVKVNPISNLQKLKRTVLANMLWEDQFYEDGTSSANRIKELVHTVKLQDAASLAIEARTKMKLRHAPLAIVREMARHPEITKFPGLVAQTLSEVIQRPDELAEFLALYWDEKKQPLSKQVKTGLANAFGKFNEYSFAKYNRDNAIKLRDVLFLVHAKPKNAEQEALFKKIVDDTLTTPDTWEVALSSGADKRATFERLMDEKKLGALAFLRNLRNMREAGVSVQSIATYAKDINPERVLPFTFISAYRHNPEFKDIIQDVMFRCLESIPKLKGRTLLVVDTSGSMGMGISGKSKMTRYEAAAALTVLAKEICEEPTIYLTAGNDGALRHATMKITNNKRGFDLADYITSSEVRTKIGGGGIFLKQCMDYIADQESESFDRVIVFTDEMDVDNKANPAHAKRLGKFNYISNVGSYENGINSKDWITITGFSEALLVYISAYEELAV